MGPATLKQRLRGIRVPDPFDLDLFCAEVSASRGRPLHRQPLAGLGPGAPCGLYLGLPAADYVFYDPETSPLHAEHIVLHEIAHMLCGHGQRTGNTDLAAQLFPDLDPAMISRMLARAAYSTEQEREAEMLASMIRTTREPSTAHDPGAGRMFGNATLGTAVNRIADALGATGR
ncbi:hypothetical protein ACTI_75870 [Actinoplanes sp. OR16]|uniref:hypothetical protein n=1 Tax=Actinoplanes sp. OR16 TaxID=946334 RepID=UPI000F71DF5F|nr:hypothetical protein [Actinoplanes sp. OR16]BBH70902.1 hypothetical protein ACTI_75870 [Actinoplanes sp. OR16]